MASCSWHKMVWLRLEGSQEPGAAQSSGAGAEQNSAGCCQRRLQGLRAGTGSSEQHGWETGTQSWAVSLALSDGLLSSCHGQGKGLFSTINSLMQPPRNASACFETGTELPESAQGADHTETPSHGATVQPGGEHWLHHQPPITMRDQGHGETPKGGAGKSKAASPPPFFYSRVGAHARVERDQRYRSC